ncbi:Pex12 amino terminal region-domain-containing protein [Epithele typhae]|uniref:Pex12 amino terminal region-domain-containing protein n=1 Tax=Epithele typhae TaxID=378194 RepID=UPI0020071FAB|nr:Pex12 amino terminal region-domain-containing protein [Epithele typhae]KAH9927507.1 Pex12 amino terminal region-domain-containing protein [Epithele typhae]
MSPPLPSFPLAQQAQIIRSNQRDVFQVASLREEAENVLRSWLGTRWLTRWDKEIDFAVNILYYGLTVGLGSQTLGEEYTDIWLHPSRTRRRLNPRLRAALVLLPTLPSYLLHKWGASLSQTSLIGATLRNIPTLLEVLAEVNLAIFYLRGTYYNLVKRLLGIKYISAIPGNPNARPPSYALLGILLGVRLIHRALTYLRTRAKPGAVNGTKGKRISDGEDEIYIDDRRISTILEDANVEDPPPVPADEDERTVLDVANLPPAVRAGRTCTLCLEERTATCATDCGHLFCWNCIVGWGREKAECPLCRQSLNLASLLPIYNL